MKSAFNCKVCGNDRYHVCWISQDRMLHIQGDYTLACCDRCHIISLFPQPTRRQLALHYPSTKYYSYNKRNQNGFFTNLRSYLVRHYYNPTFLSMMVSFFVHNVPALPTKPINGKIMDVGCGTGDTLVLLKELGWDTYGSDINSRAIAIAKQQGIDHTILGPYQTLRSYPNNFFDVIRLYHVIEHIDDPVDCIALVSRKLKKGGELILGTPNADSLVARIFGTYWYNLDSPRHLFVFTPKTLTSVLSRQGFTPCHAEFCSAGGILGSIQYLLYEKFNMNIHLIHTAWLVVLVYPIEWIVDQLRLGDVFVMRASK